jgi:hypothetical protein
MSTEPKIVCGKCRIFGVSRELRCKTVEAVRAHYASQPTKRTRKAQPKG